MVLALATAVAFAGAVVKYTWPGRNLKRDGVPNRSLIAGGLLGIVGFFVVPVVGLFLGFVLGIFLSELARLHTPKLAWPSTWSALKATGLSMFIELATGFAIAATWGTGLYLLS